MKSHTLREADRLQQTNSIHKHWEENVPLFSSLRSSKSKASRKRGTLYALRVTLQNSELQTWDFQTGGCLAQRNPRSTERPYPHRSQLHSLPTFFPSVVVEPLSAPGLIPGARSFQFDLLSQWPTHLSPATRPASATLLPSRTQETSCARTRDSRAALKLHLPSSPVTFGKRRMRGFSAFKPEGAGWGRGAALRGGAGWLALGPWCWSSAAGVGRAAAGSKSERRHGHLSEEDH